MFRNGKIYDAFLKPHIGTDIDGGVPAETGKAYYKSLMKQKLPTEYISG